jgi:hypothetical protein
MASAELFFIIDHGLKILDLHQCGFIILDNKKKYNTSIENKYLSFV